MSVIYQLSRYLCFVITLFQNQVLVATIASNFISSLTISSKPQLKPPIPKTLIRILLSILVSSFQNLFWVWRWRASAPMALFWMTCSALLGRFWWLRQPLLLPSLLLSPSCWYALFYLNLFHFSGCELVFTSLIVFSFLHWGFYIGGLCYFVL